jgi:hypothetical protein
MITSRDGGYTWSEPVTINDTVLDDRDTGLCVLRNGTMVMSFFTAYFPDVEHHVRAWPHVGDAVVDSWKPIQPIVTEADRERWLGSWTRRSDDGGVTWEAAVRVPVSAPHGPIELRDGRLLYLGYEWRTRGSSDNPFAGAAHSMDGGRTWGLIGEVPVGLSTPNPGISEPHVVETDDGRLIGLFRYNPNNDLNTYQMLQTESSDGGYTWSTLRPTPIWGGPPHLIRLRDGKLLVTYGYRRAPFGQRACLSHDNGATWDIENEMVLRDDAPDADLGYPSSVELEDGSIYTVYYQVDKPGEKPSIMGTHWQLAGH